MRGYPVQDIQDLLVAEGFPVLGIGIIAALDLVRQQHKKCGILPSLRIYLMAPYSGALFLADNSKDAASQRG